MIIFYLVNNLSLASSAYMITYGYAIIGDICVSGCDICTHTLHIHIILQNPKTLHIHIIFQNPRLSPHLLRSRHTSASLCRQTVTRDPSTPSLGLMRSSNARPRLLSIIYRYEFGQM